MKIMERMIVFDTNQEAMDVANEIGNAAIAARVLGSPNDKENAADLQYLRKDPAYLPKLEKMLSEMSSELFDKNDK